MRKSNKMRPIHPGEILADEVKALNLSARKFAAAIKVPTNRVTATAFVGMPETVSLLYSTGMD